MKEGQKDGFYMWGEVWVKSGFGGAVVVCLEKEAGTVKTGWRKNK